jgi:hypothetical protein
VDLLERRLRDLSNLRSRVLGVIDGEHDTHVQVVEFAGEYGVGSRGNSDAAYMRAIVMAATAAWDSIALVLDLRELDYSWGYALLSVIQAAEQLHHSDTDPPFPVKIVASDRCRAALLTLLGTTEDDARTWLFDSIDEAIVAARADARVYLEETGEIALPGAR